MPIRLAVVDDQALVRTGLRMILESEPDLQVVAEAGTGSDAIHEVRRTRPDVVLMDIEMPGMSGVEATRRILEAAPDSAVRILMLTTFERDDYIFDALRAGASGFLLKNTPAEDLIAAVRTVHAGDALLAPSVTRRVIAGFVQASPALLDRGRLQGLTPRETDVLRLVGAGMSNAEVAGSLYLSEGTVKTHLSSVLSKLGLRDRAQAVVFAYESGLIRPGRRSP